jgi:hypothetical protein
MTRPGPDTLLQPLFEETPVPPSIRPPLGAPKSWERIIVTRAQLQCECAGQCGVTHKQTAGRCPRRHEGRHNKRTTLLVVAPRPELLALPLHKVVALPDDKLMAWCGECETRAKKLAATQ